MEKSSEAPSPALSRERVGERACPGGHYYEDGRPIHRRSTKRAKELRQNQTEAEKIMWHRLKAKQLLGYKFKRQVPVGPYYADFACHEINLIIEIDGGQHNENKKDEIRTKFLNEQGYKVLRFWNNDVMNNVEGVFQTLTEWIAREWPSPPALSRDSAGEGAKEKAQHGQP